MNNIVFFDIDGTLVSETDYSIPDSTLKALKLLKDKGNLAFINTGRPLSEISNNIRNLNFDGFVCGCGTYLEYKGKELFHKSFGKKLSAEVTRDILKYNFEAILEGKNGVYFDKEENIKDKIVIKLINQHKIEGFYKGTTWYDDNIDIDKFVIFLNENSDFNGFYEKYKNVFDFIKRNDTFYEIVPAGYSKASGIKAIIKYLNIPFENTYAIGDSTNDLSMLQYAHTSIAMGNSDKCLFDHVNYITTTLENDGIYNALSHFNLI